LLALFEVPVSLSRFRPRLEAAASKSLKQSVALEGDVHVTLRRDLSLDATLEEVRIAGEDPEQDRPLLEAGRLQAGVRLPGLLKREIVLSLVELENAECSIPPRKRRPKQRRKKVAVPAPEPRPESSDETADDDFELLGIDRIQLENVRIRHLPRKATEIQEDFIETLEGSAGAHEPVRISARLLYQDQASSIEMEIDNTLDELMERDHASTSALEVVVGDTSIEGTAVLDYSAEERSVTVRGATRSPSLRTLGRILQEDWPDVGPVDGALTFIDTRDLRKVENIRAKMGNTFLTGYIHMTRDKQREMYFKAEKADLIDVFKVLEVDAEGLEGIVERVEFKMTQPGGLREVRKRNREISVTAHGGALQYEYEGREWLKLDVNDLSVERTPGIGDVMLLDGAWLGEEVSLSVRRSLPREDPQDDRREAVLHLEGAGASVIVKGLLKGKNLNKETELAIALSSERIGRLSKWLGTDSSCNLPLQLHSRVRQSNDALTVDGLELVLGENNLRGEFYRAKKDDGESFFARLESDLLNVDAISAAGFHNILKREKRKPRAGSVVPTPEENDEPPARESSGLKLDIPIWPDPVDVPDVDVEGTIARFIVGDQELRDLRITGKSLGGDVKQAAVRCSYGETTFGGNFSLRLSADVPEARLDVIAEQVDVSDLLSRRRIAEGTEFRADRFQLHTLGRGSTLSELLRWSDFSVGLTRGQYFYRKPGDEETMEIVVESAEATALRDKPVRFEAYGLVDGEPLSVRLHSDLSREMIPGLDRVPFELDLSGFGVDLELRADIRLPFDRMNHTFDLRISGESLENVATNYVRLPPLGPYALSAHLDIDDTGYRLSDFELALGSSRLGGSADLITSEERPRFEIALSSPSLQLDELSAADWVDKSRKKREKKKEEPGVSVSAPPPEKKKKPSTMEYLLENVDGHIEFKVNEVISGGDPLGSGVLHATLNRGRLDINPLYAAFGDGEIELRAGLEERESGLSAELHLKARQFDYGVLARRMDRKTDMAGRFSVDTQIWGEGENWEDLLAHANGYLHLGVFPENLDASILDLWAANLIMTLMRKADDPKNSKFNCLMARFALEDGLVTDRTLVLDTTRVRVKGTGTIDLQNEALRLKLKPKSKKPRFFSLETPITVKGSLDKPKVSLDAWDVTRSIGGFVFSIVTVPFQWMVADPPPSDGSDVCAQWEEILE
jgi:uncharacterized protein involved in outer membrane biogenesis